MSFRNRLTLFFLAIVIVPMVSVAVVLFRLVADNEQGKADARVAQGQEAAIGLYRREVRRADRALGRLADDPDLVAAMGVGDQAEAAARARLLLGELRLRRIAVTRRGRTLVDIGPRSATAPARRRLVGSGGGAVGELRASSVTAGEYVRLVRQVTGLDAAVQRGDRTIATTLPRLGDRALPRVGTVAIAGSDYRAASVSTPGFGPSPTKVAVLFDVDETSSEIGTGRVVIGLILLGFLVLAFVFALAVSRSLQSQIARFLAGAKRLAGGDFSTTVPTEGNDEFAALAEQFNTMSRQLEARVEELQQERARLQRSIRRIGQTAASNLDRHALLGIVVSAAVDALRAGAGRATVRAAPGSALVQAAAAGELVPLAGIIRDAEARALESGAPAEATSEGFAAMSYPLARSGSSVEALITVARQGAAFSADEVDLFHYLANQAAVSLENVDLHELVQRQAVTDELTGLFNHRRFQEVVAAEVERARRFEQPLGLVMLDIDDFKRVNDTYGHQQGDLVLRAVADVLRESCREIDEPARYGGEELAVALPQTDLEGAFNLAERVRTAIEELELPRVDGDGPLRVTASFGVSAIPEIAAGKEGLIAAADAALYRAKRAGKNRTERAEPSPADPARAK